jgi:pimeloyl-ACP methyl ester carboxylesterase
VVVAVDGSGNLRPWATDLEHAVADAGLHLQVLPFDWSHGPGRVFSDICSDSRHRAKGEELARLLLDKRRNCPAQKLYIVCHSSGAAVVLAAADWLPPDSVDRIVLLAPFVSSGYDLCPALRCSREGIDCFYSRWDLASRMTLLIGTADRCWQFAAGCVGFTPEGDGDVAKGLYRKLRQHPWDAEMRQVADYGGHFGCTRPGFFRRYVVPLLQSCRGEGELIRGPGFGGADGVPLPQGGRTSTPCVRSTRGTREN